MNVFDNLALIIAGGGRDLPSDSHGNAYEERICAQKDYMYNH